MGTGRKAQPPNSVPLTKYVETEEQARKRGDLGVGVLGHYVIQDADQITIVTLRHFKQRPRTRLES